MMNGWFQEIKLHDFGNLIKFEYKYIGVCE